MSGQLVGEVIAASNSLRARGLSERGFHALVAIAEKASAHDRTASVRWDHVRAGLYGASKRTAERAVDDAKKAGVVEVVLPGFRNQHGVSRAPVYRIASLVDTDTQLSSSTVEDHDTQVSSSKKLDTDKPELDTDKRGVDTDTQVSYLTFPYDGSLDGGEAHDADVPGDSLSSNPHTEEIIDAVVVDDAPADPEPRRYCTAHMPYGTPDPCGLCGIARHHHEAWSKRNEVDPLRGWAEIAHEARINEIRHAIDHCPNHCDDWGRLDDLTDCPLHDNFRTQGATT